MLVNLIQNGTNYLRYRCIPIGVSLERDEFFTLLTINDGNNAIRIYLNGDDDRELAALLKSLPNKAHLIEVMPFRGDRE